MSDLIFVNATEPAFGFHQGMTLVQVHSVDKCAGEVCCVHNPSEHHMRTWPQTWRADKGLMERECPHGVGHPDPDDLKVRTSRSAGIHGCDGCCYRQS